ncbi:MAG TPA: hypothetical protein VFZ25_11510 [Chloroflexota bacterium]|nr:hypothetical protein [Chloroflexota bacterium]
MKEFKNGDKIDVTFISEAYRPILGAKLVDSDELGVTVALESPSRIVFLPWNAIQSVSRDVDEKPPAAEAAKPARASKK